MKKAMEELETLILKRMRYVKKLAITTLNILVFVLKNLPDILLLSIKSSLEKY